MTHVLVFVAGVLVCLAVIKGHQIAQDIWNSFDR